MNAGNCSQAYTDICNLLNAPKFDYYLGLAVFASYEDKPATLAHLRAQKNPAKLQSLLMGLLQRSKDLMAKQPDTPAAANVPMTATQAKPAGKNKYYDQWVQCIQDIRALQADLFFIGRDAVTKEERPLTQEEEKQRYALSSQLIAKDDLCHDLLVAMKTGKMPRPEVKLPKKQAAADGETVSYHQYENARKNVKRLQGKIEAFSGERLPKSESLDEIKKIGAKLSEWESKLQTNQAIVDEYRKANQ